jgi:hypothetical protein
MPQGKFEMKKFEIFHFKFELKFFVFDFWKNWPYHQREMENFEKKIEIWKKWPYHRGKMKKIKFFIFEIWNANLKKKIGHVTGGKWTNWKEKII